ncbi:4-(cytidine 5'-diphospho)-2-C-methyl-D-erythritol kinase [Candidatus Sulfurimonas marisnigri]|uniref:4-(Cytidine 5'-diphospho)-2-C-methyl-D-erythritol kinase n=1 Tax=Candidatus Sulfurimonas marisnigri TaxID=2740405 RepID=A0A7S7RRA1_9BACT|nr:4-(cytidine 5'-diphospho)-2-C-methyl-D-erythritol kinase [Candidatus Sulfurimonas marisnigri]QOY55320.1 4-(cytidine 5'-diphospho)-2-C-methyl-D-erythritol kinase [Candidatus Sulfurimonas marisnigri]
MGGFAGGDEGGYWDIDTLPTSTDKQNNNKSKNTNRGKPYIETSDSGYSIKAHAKINIFLKITGYKDGYHTLLSRVMRVEKLYDTISFVPCKCETFTIEGCDEIPLESNTIYKAFAALNDFSADSDILDFFYEHKVVVTKRIPSQSGLGGSSSDAAAFMRLVKGVCNLILSTDELAKIASTISPDLPFFIYNYPSANVSGFGEIVEPFEEEPLHFELYALDIECDKSLLYKTFKKHLLANVSLSSFFGWDKLDSKSILDLISDPIILNDLYSSSLLAYPDLRKEAIEGWFFSGSTFFKY